MVGERDAPALDAAVRWNEPSNKGDERVPDRQHKAKRRATPGKSESVRIDRASWLLDNNYSRGSFGHERR